MNWMLIWRRRMGSHHAYGPQNGARVRRALVAAMSVGVICGVAVPQAQAAFGIQSWSAAITQNDGVTPETQAGAHPAAITTSFTLATNSSGAPDGYAKDIEVSLPPGLVGNPQAIPKCSWTDLNPGQGAPPNCAADTQVGYANLSFDISGSVGSFGEVGVYNMQPRNGDVADFGFQVLGVESFDLRVSVRTGTDYGIDIQIENAPTVLQLAGASFTFWGVPADPINNSNRFASGSSTPGASSGAPIAAFLTNPTACGSALAMSLSVDSWAIPGKYVTSTATTPATTGCDGLTFAPQLRVQPTTNVANSPTGLAVALSVPQNDDPSGVATPALQDAAVTLPQGISLSPSAADGLTACTPVEIGLANDSEPSCPETSKIGSVEIDTPLLPDALRGGIYVAQQDDNPFDSLLAIYVTAEGDGVVVKLAGHVVADPGTGQLTTTFSNTPQLPFTDFKLDFFGGPRAALATPEACGTYTTTSSLTPWSGGPAATPSDSFTISSGCVSGFQPTFTAGATNAQAGAYSPFVMSFSRADTDQELSDLTVKLPTGLLAKLATVQECTDAELAAAASSAGTAEEASPSCPAGSRVGSVEVGAGPGSEPFFLPGTVYLTGPYKGGPYGLAVVVPAVAGPYDLGTVVVRQALYVDPTTAQVTDLSDPFPTILDGIPLRIRRIDVDLNRPGFTVNPTSCDPTSVAGTLTSTQGAQAAVSSRFQVGGCQALRFSPRLRMALTGRGRTRSGDHPALTATLTQGAGQANIHTVRVTLPLSMALDPNNSQHVCGYEAALSVHGGAVPCPASTIVGSATAVTPLLSQPLTGPVYLVQGIRYSRGQMIRTLPTLLIPLRGQIALDLRAKTSVNAGGALVTTFSTIPDAPVSRFTLSITGGRRGILVVTGRGRSICTGAQVADSEMGAQSGKTRSESVRMSTPCGRPARLRVLSHRVHARTLTLRVRSSSRGRLTVTGHGVRRYSRELRAGTQRVRLHLTGQATRVRLRLALTPVNARPAWRTFTVRV